MVAPRFFGFVRTFVFICVGVFILEMFARFNPDGGQLFQTLIRFFGIVPELFFKGMVYQAVTWVFFHGDLLHLLFNMFGFWMFGSLLQESFGERRFMTFVATAGILSGLIVATVGIFTPEMSNVPTIGASGIVFAILVAVSRMFPNQVVLFLFIFPMKLKYFAYLLIALEFYALWQSNSQGISNIAHLGGALIGWFYVSSSGSPSHWLRNIRDRWRHRRMRRKLRVVKNEGNKWQRLN